MTITAHVVFTADSTKHIAWNTGTGTREAWQVSWCPELKLTQDQAIAALNIAELVNSGYVSPDRGIVDLPGWAAALGIDPKVAVGQVNDRRAWGCAVRYAHLPWQHKGILLLLGTYFDTTGVYHRPATADLVKVTQLAEQHIVDLLFELERDSWFSWHPVTGAECNAEQPARLLQLDHLVVKPVMTVPRDGDCL
jgi:hypothetical protein